jgi:hypothetical protein
VLLEQEALRVEQGKQRKRGVTGIALSQAHAKPDQGSEKHTRIEITTGTARTRVSHTQQHRR